jgi:hypothetical protein
MIKFLLGLFILILAGCATPPQISNAPTSLQATIAKTVAQPDSLIATGLQDAAFNFDQAVAIGVLPADDPAPKCAHDALRLAGLEQVPGAVEAKSFTPRVSDAISAGSVLYIQARQAKGAKPFEASQDCKALLGTIVLDALRAGVAVRGLPALSVLGGRAVIPGL